MLDVDYTRTSQRTVPCACAPQRVGNNSGWPKLTATTFPATTNYSNNTSSGCKLQPHHFQRLPTIATSPQRQQLRRNCHNVWYRLRPVHLRHHHHVNNDTTAPTTTTTSKSTTLCTNNNNTNVNNCVGTTTIHAWYRRPVHLRHHFDWVYTTPTPPQTGLRYTHRAANHGTANGFHYDQIYGPAPRPRRRTLHVQPHRHSANRKLHHPHYGVKPERKQLPVPTTLQRKILRKQSSVTWSEPNSKSQINDPRAKIPLPASPH